MDSPMRLKSPNAKLRSPYMREKRTVNTGAVRSPLAAHSKVLNAQAPVVKAVKKKRTALSNSSRRQSPGKRKVKKKMVRRPQNGAGKVAKEQSDSVFEDNLQTVFRDYEQAFQSDSCGTSLDASPIQAPMTYNGSSRQADQMPYSSVMSTSMLIDEGEILAELEEERSLNRELQEEVIRLREALHAVKKVTASCATTVKGATAIRSVGVQPVKMPTPQMVFVDSSGARSDESNFSIQECTYSSVSLSGSFYAESCGTASPASESSDIEILPIEPISMVAHARASPTTSRRNSAFASRKASPLVPMHMRTTPKGGGGRPSLAGVQGKVKSNLQFFKALEKTRHMR